jgi:putative effector of murein hydrolase
VFVTALGAALVLRLFSAAAGLPHDTVLRAYYGSGRGPGDLLAALLVPAVVSYGFQLHKYRLLLQAHLVTVLATTVLAASFGLGSSALLARLLGVRPQSLALATFTRCATSPLALTGAQLLGAEGSVAALLVALTGMLGAVAGPPLLAVLGVREDLAVGLSMGASAHGVGTAAVADRPPQFAAAVVSMTLTGLWTVALLSHQGTRAALTALAGF